ncbi:glycoside hydrolase family 2 TIM barrel-domain containing protein [Microvirga brassicacearum]|uniref:DUF4982 domain-containing protein n=1 Tax=Microvirga brassicacearum TaxID=2580413 RepID=A0A5N3P763_9HYPH|nr:glycoside hydrolase family 2 TIM barrel-domain containing protein [Microvirga brassicacearum]KAB0265570.1 DUF4982 domain-containing protein [Microvirga brassicacearum]
MKRIWIQALVLAAISSAAIAQDTQTSNPNVSVSATELRITTGLQQGWKFIQDDQLSDDAAKDSTAANWEAVNLPHTWNADAASMSASQSYKRGLGWYRLEFDTPAAGARHWLEFGAASLVADVWLNGYKLGRHQGGFTLFRFDVTNVLAPVGRNVLLVKVDNGKPTSDDDVTAIPPLAGDYIMYGGLYRHVSLVSTLDPVHFDLADLGGPGVYATTNSVSGSSATINVRAKLKSASKEDGDYIVRASMLEADGRVADSTQQTVSLRAGSDPAVTQDLRLRQPRLWQGVEDPYQYKLVADLLRADGQVIDRVVQDFGIREIHIDPNHGFFLNGKHVPLRGVALHQETYGKGWAQSPRDIDASLALVKEIGANTVRLGHYPFDRHTLESLNRMGLVAWSELPVGIGVTTEVNISSASSGRSVCPRRDASAAFRASARQQLREMIRQQYNHAAVAVWSLGNETTYMHRECTEPWHDNLTAVFEELHALAKQEDPRRLTAYADFTSKDTPPVNGSYIDLGGITDVWSLNKYQLWYGGPVPRLATILDALRKRFPGQPIGISEYGAGAAVTHHTDNIRGGPVETNNPGMVPVVYQPEEYAGYVHEQNYALILSRNYLWATHVWNMFDFGSDLRNEGDAKGVNTKGLVSFDRKVRKDPFFFYKANWSGEPVTYITSRRHTNRAYPVTDVKVYSNADSVELSVNDMAAGTLRQEQCLLKACVFRSVTLRPGVNKVAAVGHRGGATVRDTVEWSLDATGVNIAAGQIAAGFRSASGELFGSDNFFIGGEGGWLVPKNGDVPEDTTPVRGSDNPALFKNYRSGAFSYYIPLEDGPYTVTLGFLEPDRTTEVRQRLFDVVANGVTQIDNLDVLQAAGAYRTVVSRTFTTIVSDGHLKLDFVPERGDAIVSNLVVKPSEAATGSVETAPHQ